MKGFYWGNGAVRCSYCATVGHNITTCSVIDRDANGALHKMQLDPTYVCSPHEHAALVEIKRREERKNKKRKPRKAPRCSFCKSHGHKRPSCPSLKDFRQKVYMANKNWKRIFAQRASEVGIGVGALVQFDQNTVCSLDFNVDPHRIAMITSYDLRNLNVFCALTDHNDYQSNSTFQVMLGDRCDNVSVKYMSRLMGEGLLHEGWWYSTAQPVVLSPMKFTADPEWLEAEWNEILNWFFKKITVEELFESGVLTFIETWAKKV